MIDDDGVNVQNIHKEEAQARICSDNNRLYPVSYPEGIVNIVNGRVGPVTICVHDFLEAGREQMSEFERTWPEQFHDTVNKKITTMAVKKKSIKKLV